MLTAYCGNSFFVSDRTQEMKFQNNSLFKYVSSFSHVLRKAMTAMTATGRICVVSSSICYLFHLLPPPAHFPLPTPYPPPPPPPPRRAFTSASCCYFTMASVGQLELVSPHSIDPMLFQCWASVVYDGPTLKYHWVDV